jgi:hypothetical protein
MQRIGWKSKLAVVVVGGYEEGRRDVEWRLGTQSDSFGDIHLKVHKYNNDGQRSSL